MFSSSQEALMFLDQTAALAHVPRNQHAMAQAAVEFLRKALAEPPKAVEPAEEAA